MHNTILILALGLLRLSNAMSTVTVSVNTGDCPATYSSNSTDSWPYPTATSSSATASTTSLIYPETPCPASPGSSYMDLAGVEYNVYCNTGMIGSDLGAVNASSFDECLGICDVYLPPDAVSPACEAVTFTTTYVATGNCQLKFDIKDVILLTYPAHSAEIAQVDSTPDDGASISSVLATASASTSASVSQSVAGSSTSSPAPVVTPTPAEPCPCPALDNQTISDSQTLSWHLQCDASKYNNSNNHSCLTYVPSFHHL